MEWLNKNNICFDKLIVRGADKGKLCKENKIDIFLDDYVHNVLRINELGIEGVIFTARHNESFENKSVKRVNNWQEFYDYINEIKQRN